MSDDNAQGGQGPIGGRHNSRLSEVKASFKLDTAQLNSFKKHLEDVRKKVIEVRDAMEELAAASAKVSSGVSGSAIPGKGGTLKGFPSAFGATRVNTSQPSVTQSSPTAAATGAASSADGLVALRNMARAFGSSRAAGVGIMASGRAAMGVPGAAGVALGAAQIAGNAYKRFEAGVSGINASIDSRIERGIEYASSADKLNMLMQQMYGMSQRAVMEDFRRPMTEYRLGAGGINAMMQFQTETGVEATPGLGQSLAGIRAATGYSKSTSQILSQQRSLMDPRVANRMLFMAGVNAYEYGGGMKDPMQMRQELITNLGLDNERVLSGAFAPGSVTRARMADLGIGEEMQTELLQMARQQVEFTRRGGEGAYDPGLVEHRELMGVEGNLVSQQEETTRREVQREENFMRRQIDNMATREKIDRQLIVVLGKLEDTLSGLVGGKITIGNIGNRIAGGILGLPGKLVSAIPGVGDQPDSGGGVVGAGNVPSGLNDSSRDSQIKVPSGGRGSAKTTLSQLKQRPDVAKLHPSLKERIFRMMRVNPNIGITSGYRSFNEQESVFLSKMEPVSEEEAASMDQSLVTTWNGQKYAPKEGENFAAAPGRSVHALGLAADIFEEGDNQSYAWIVANSSKFGLNNWRAKGWRHDEPWHVQPDTVPRSYDDLIAAGYSPPEGLSEGLRQRFGLDSEGEDAYEYHEDYRTHVGPTSTSGMTTSDIIESERSKARGALGPGGSSQPVSRTGPRGAPSPGGSPSSNASGKPISAQEVARYAYEAGFRGEDLVKAVAIAGRESGFTPRILNPDAGTGDQSYGLMQINMLGDLGPERLKAFGISSNSQLYDPLTNMNAAYMLYQGRGNTFYDWGPYKGMEATYNTDLGAARDAVLAAGYEATGDATSRSMKIPTKAPSSQGHSRGSGGTVNVSNSPNITVSPVINFNGTPQTPDLHSIAITVSRMIEKEVKMLDLRSS